ncbi:MAG TPA: hypothetical protein VGI54_09425, partial [Solirubrobacteraceae bacterium]
LCARIAIVDHGERIALDTPAGLRGLLPHARGLELTLRAETDPADALASLGEVESAPAGEGEWRIRLYSDEATPAQALAAVSRTGAEVLDLAKIEGTLEDVFVHLTGRELR